MQDEFKQVAERFGKYAPPVAPLDDAAWQKLVSKIQVVIPAGGESKRLRGVTQSGYNKISSPLPNGDTLIEYNIRMYRDAGMTDFLLLIGHEAESVVKLLGKGEKLGVSIRYSRDPGKP